MGRGEESGVSNHVVRFKINNPDHRYCSYTPEIRPPRYIKQISLNSVSDLPIGLTGWSPVLQNLGDLRPRCIMFLTRSLDFDTYMLSYITQLYSLNNPSVNFLAQLHPILEYCRILDTSHHPRLYSNWLNTLQYSSSRHD